MEREAAAVTDGAHAAWAPAPPPLRLGALLVLCSLSGLAVPVGSGSTAGELSAAALLLPLLPLLPPPVALADSHATHCTPT